MLKFKLFSSSVNITFAVLFINIIGNRAAEIRRISVPRWVENGTTHPVVLDCDYIYNENDYRLVIKWFFKDNSEPVYQWIPELNHRQVSPLLRNHLDFDFAVNTIDPFCKYRALRLYEPTIELTGKYTCVVTSLAGWDSEEQVMTVFVPADEFELNYSEVTNDEINVTCEVWNVFPFPQLNMFLYSSSNSPPKPVNSVTSVSEMKPSGAYNVFISRTFTWSELSNENITIFECLLHLPGTNYTQSKRLTYITDERGRRIGERGGGGIDEQAGAIGLPDGLSSSSSSLYISRYHLNLYIFYSRIIFCFVFIVAVAKT